MFNCVGKAELSAAFTPVLQTLLSEIILTCWFGIFRNICYYYLCGKSNAA